MEKGQYIIELLRDEGVLRAQELAEHGIAPEYLNLLADKGVIERVARGIYASADFGETEHLDLLIVQKRVPAGVFCLQTALHFHGLTTQIATKVHLAVARGQHSPQLEWPPLEVVHISTNQFAAGIEEHALDSGHLLRVYSPARTVADCFKFRSRVGLDVAIEALRDYRTQNRGSVGELMAMAEVCRVRSVMRPYVEAIL